jgi:hypothetical protein
MSNIVKWIDYFEEDHLFVAGEKDDVFHIIPNKRDDEGNSYVQILSKQAIIDMANLLQQRNA